MDAALSHGAGCGEQSSGLQAQATGWFSALVKGQHAPSPMVTLQVLVFDLKVRL